MSDAPNDKDLTSAPDAAVPDQTVLYSALAGGALTLIAVGTVVFHWLENWGWIDSFYYSVIAVTTVGFGDFAPETDAGKLVTVAYVVIGISLVAAFLDARLHRAAARRGSRRSPGPHGQRDIE